MQNSLMNRLIGIITFKAPVYQEIAKDPTATTPALLIVIVVAVVSGLITGLGGQYFLAVVLTAIVSQVLAWVVGAWVLSFVGKLLFKGAATTSDMMRINGFTTIFQILTIIPVVGIIGSLLQIVANVLGVREAAGMTTGKAVVTAIIAGIVVIILATLVATIFAAILIVPAALAK